MTDDRRTDPRTPEPRRSPAPFGVDDLRALRASGDIHALIDVRELPETDAGHIPGASTVPLRTLPLRLEQLIPTPHLDVVVVDAGGADRRAAAAVVILARAGVIRPVVLDGGLAAWTAAGGRVERGRNVPSKRFGELLVEPQEDLQVAPETLAAWIEEGRVDRILDVRTTAEHRRECVPGSQHAAGFDVVAAALSRTDPTRPLVVHCTGRTRGIVAASTLRMLGIPNVYALENGTMGWKLAGLTLEHDADRSAPADPSAATEVLAAAWRLAEEVGVQRVTPRAADALVRGQARPTLLIDVRAPAESATASPESAFAVASGQLVQQLDDHVVIAGAHVILIDDGGVRAPIAAHWLRRIGVAAASVVDGGVAAWAAAGLPLVSALERQDPRLVGLAKDAIRREGAVVAAEDLEQALVGAHAGGGSIVSVSTSTEHAAGHVLGSVWTAASRIIEDPSGAARSLPEGPLVLTCEDGGLSAYLAALLREVGRDDVRWLQGGLRAWRSGQRPVATGTDGLPAPAPDAIEHPIHIGPHAMQAYLDWELELDHDPSDTA